MPGDSYQKPRVISMHDVGSYGHGDALFAAGNAIAALLYMAVAVFLHVATVFQAAVETVWAVHLAVKVTTVSKDGGGHQGGC